VPSTFLGRVSLAPDALEIGGGFSLFFLRHRFPVHYFFWQTLVLSEAAAVFILAFFQLKVHRKTTPLWGGLAFFARLLFRVLEPVRLERWAESLYYKFLHFLEANNVAVISPSKYASFL